MENKNLYYDYLVRKKHTYGVRTIYARQQNNLKDMVFYHNLYLLYKNNAKTFRVALKLSNQNK